MEVLFECRMRLYACAHCGLTVCAGDCEGGREALASCSVVFGAAARIMHRVGIVSLEVSEVWAWDDQVGLGDAGILWAYRKKRADVCTQPLSLP